MRLLETIIDRLLIILIGTALFLFALSAIDVRGSEEQASSERAKLAALEEAVLQATLSADFCGTTLNENAIVSAMVAQNLSGRFGEFFDILEPRLQSLSRLLYASSRSDQAAFCVHAIRSMTTSGWLLYGEFPEHYLDISRSKVPAEATNSVLKILEAVVEECHGLVGFASSIRAERVEYHHISNPALARPLSGSVAPWMSHLRYFFIVDDTGPRMHPRWADHRFSVEVNLQTSEITAGKSMGAIVCGLLINRGGGNSARYAPAVARLDPEIIIMPPDDTDATPRADGWIPG